MQEKWRRISRLMKATGLTQTRIAYITGTQQPEVAKWKALSDGSRVIPRMEAFAEYLANPTKPINGMEIPMRSERPPQAEPYSPILENPTLASELALAVFDENVSPESWDQKLDGQLWTHSKAPFSASELIRLREDAPEPVKGYRMPPERDVFLADLQVHGEQFVQRMRADWHARDAMAKAEKDELLHLARGAGGSILIYLALELEKMGRPKIRPDYLWKFREQPLSSFDMSKENIERMMGSSWLEQPEKFVPAMEFLAVIADWVTDSAGEPISPLLERVLGVASTFGKTLRYNQQQNRRGQAQARNMDSDVGNPCVRN